MNLICLKFPLGYLRRASTDEVERMHPLSYRARTLTSNTPMLGTRVGTTDLRKSSGSLAIFAAIRLVSSRTKDQALLLRLFCADTGWRLWARSAWRRPNGTPRVVRLLIGNLTGRRFVVIVDLLLLWREYVLAPSQPSRRTLRGSVCSH